MKEPAIPLPSYGNGEKLLVFVINFNKAKVMRQLFSEIPKFNHKLLRNFDEYQFATQLGFLGWKIQLKGKLKLK